MRRALVVVVVAIGCGRFGFDARTAPPDASLDAPPNIQLVQALQPGYGSAASVSYPITLTAGDLLVAAVYWHQTADVVAVTDAANLAWQALPTSEIATGCSTGDGQGTEIALWYAPVAQSGADMVTLAQPTGVHPIGAFLLEYSGVTATVDAHAGAIAMGSGTAETAGSVTTTDTDIIVALFEDPIGLGMTMTPGSAYTSRGSDNGFYTLVEDRIAAPGSYAPDATLPAGATDGCWAGTAAAFRAR